MIICKKKKNYVNTFVSKKWMQNTKHYLPVELCGPQFLIQSGPISLSHLFLSITICVCVFPRPESHPESDHSFLKLTPETFHILTRVGLQ